MLLSLSIKKAKTVQSLKKISLLFLVAIVSWSMLLNDAEARRFGGGKSFGRQMVQRPMKRVDSQKPIQQASAQTVKPTRSKWMAPIAGLAAGLGLAALFSSLGFGEEFAQFLANGLIILAILMIGVWLYRRFFAVKKTGYAYSSSKFDNANAYQMHHKTFSSGQVNMASNDSSSVVSRPMDFGSEDFLDYAKQCFVLVQEAWSKQEMEKISAVTTPALFAQIEQDSKLLGFASDKVEVVTLHAELLVHEEDDAENIVSIHFSGLIREQSNGIAMPFNEIWNFEFNQDEFRWVLAGIQQAQEH